MNIIGSLCFSGSCTKLCNYAKLYNPILKQVRYRKQHLNKPVSHLQREIVKAVSKPRYPKWYKGLPIEEICTKSLIAKNIAEEGKVSVDIEFNLTIQLMKLRLCIVMNHIM